LLGELNSKPFEKHRAALGVVAQEADIAAPARGLKHARFAVGLCETHDGNLERDLDPVRRERLGDIGLGRILERVTNSNIPIGFESSNNIWQFSEPRRARFAFSGKIAQHFVAQLDAFNHGHL